MRNKGVAVSYTCTVLLRTLNQSFNRDSFNGGHLTSTSVFASVIRTTRYVDGTDSLQKSRHAPRGREQVSLVTSRKGLSDIYSGAGRDERWGFCRCSINDRERVTSNLRIHRYVYSRFS